MVGLIVAASPSQAATCTPLGAKSDDGSAVTCVTHPASDDARLVDLTIHSAAMNADETVRLLLPTGYDAQPDRTWPTLYLLHGAGSGTSGHVDWTTNTDVESRTAGRDVIVVMPDGGNVGYYSDWIADPAKWETFHLVELRQLLERNYHAGPDRAVAGLSMGGFGAVSYAARHPDDFRAVASYSGALHPYADYPTIRTQLLTARKDVKKLWGDPTTTSGAAVWQQHDPYYLVDKLTSIPIYVSSGDGTRGPNDPDPGSVNTESIVNAESQAFAQRLTDAYVAAHPGATGDPLLTTHFYSPGVHVWSYWTEELHASLPVLLGAIGA
ncbi:alpha/beta hydrolase family protein [Frankia sp. QA3]|uniref:alpha/beta hydrolase n=1 Tax=Frankia sp. QA3 TaxID=710111 RepID=UPI000269C9B0|nr:alpha/beta hydrolase family protein [Frankia sp. QA3]EIV94673.1 putative esterase [Frankia sp. QA3]